MKDKNTYRIHTMCHTFGYIFVYVYIKYILKYNFENDIVLGFNKGSTEIK